MKVEWSAAALADLDRFEDFLRERYPGLSPIVAREIIAKSQVLSEHPLLGRALASRQEYRQVVLRVLNARYVFQYRVMNDRLMILRVFHGRENRRPFSR
jgi:plasmid stabilization system protein ParE